MSLLVPKQIDIEATSYCNLQCKGCLVTKPGAKVDHFPTDLYKSVVDRVVKENIDTTMVPWLEGEPLMHPDYAEWCKYTSTARLPYYVTTNGTIWNDEFFEHITDPGSTCYQLIFSLDGLWSTKSIEIARPGTNRDVVQDTIMRFIKLKRKKGSEIDLCIKICKRGQDYEEIENYINYWLDNEMVDFVCVGTILEGENSESMREYPCQYSDNNFLVVKADTRIVYCAYNEEMTQDESNSVGILDYDTPILEIYNNEVFKSFRENQRKKEFHPVCKKCSFPYTGLGWRGEVRSRNPRYKHRKLYYSKDYYNEFFSLKNKKKPDSYYLGQK